MKVFIATSTFGDFSNESIDHLRQNELDVCMNKLGRKLTDNELIKFAAKCDGIIAGTEMYSRDVMEQLSQLKIISRLGVGMDNIDLDEAQQNGIKIFKTQTTPGPAVAELALGLMLDIARKISYQNNVMKSGEWKKHMGNLLYGKTLGVIGLGSIGKNLIRLTNGFNFQILAFDSYHDQKFALENNVKYCDFNSLLSNSDIITIHLNLNDETHQLINSSKISKMKPGSILVNTSRGEIIDENALYAALKSNQISGAGLDVFEKEPYSGPLTKLDNAILTPHIGSYAKEIRIQMEMEATQNLIKGLNEK
jgi:D-3-phosphoglycerate dehydrogenase|tara:strand:- start:989 stop:1912 length:924 start_codon:yes stop_codon:yes gene_type:complete